MLYSLFYLTKFIYFKALQLFWTQKGWSSLKNKVFKGIIQIYLCLKYVEAFLNNNRTDIMWLSVSISPFVVHESLHFQLYRSGWYSNLYAPEYLPVWTGLSQSNKMSLQIDDADYAETLSLLKHTHSHTISSYLARYCSDPTVYPFLS